MLRVQLKPSLSQKKRIWHHYLCLLFLGITASVIPCKKSLQPGWDWELAWKNLNHPNEPMPNGFNTRFLNPLQLHFKITLLWKSPALSVVLCFNRDLGRNRAVFALSNAFFQEQSYGNCRECVPAHQEWTWGLISWWKILISLKRNIDLSVACILF